MMDDIARAAAQVRNALADAARGLVEREVLVELIALAAVAREHVLIVGPPGTAKSEAVRRVARGLQGNYFEYLLGRFTEPTEVFGPIDLRKLKEGVVETETRGMLPEAEIAFLDEVFLGSTAILNTLLGILNERSFRRGHTNMDCPLRVAVAATNAIPDDDALAAFADRFLVRAFVEPIPDPLLEDLLSAGWSLENLSEPRVATIEEIDTLARASLQADLEAIRPHLAQAIRLLRGAGIVLSDRRVVKTQRLIAAAAVLDGRPSPERADLWPLIYALPALEQQKTARDILRDLLEPSESASLPAAAADASLGALARAGRLNETGQRLLDARPEDPEATEAWRLQLESVAREIDAGFSPETRPDDLDQLRSRLVAELGVEAEA